MVKRNNNQLPHNIPQLQNLIKRDSISYKDEFQLQYQHYKSLLQVFLMNPSQINKNLDELVIFIAQVAHCYPDILTDFAQEIISLLENQNAVLESTIRMSFCKALILLRNKNLLPPTDLLPLFFQLLRCNDKPLRVFLQSHIVNDIKTLNAKHKNIKLNTVLQNFMFKMLKDSNPKAVKLSLDIMVELFKKNVWNDTKAVNVIVTACFSKDTKVVVTALKFFLSSNDSKEDEDKSDSDDEPNPKEVMMANKVNKKTRKREKLLKKVKQLVQKSKKKKFAAPAFNISALHLVHDPQGFAEKLFHNLESTHERFEVRLMTLDVVSRLIGIHQLIVLNFYPYIQKFLQPHQKDVTKLLLYTAQACHELVPPDVLEPILRTLVNNFVTERNSSDVMAIGLNAVREMCSRCPLVMNEDLLQDLIQYKTHRERSVMMAARSLIQLYRHNMPSLLHKKYRGRPTEAAMDIRVKSFGEISMTDYVPGAEVLIDENEVTTDVNFKQAMELKQKQAAEVSVTRILTDEDFKAIDNVVIRKQTDPLKRGMKRKLEEEPKSTKETVSIEDIENIFKKKKHDKQSRIESVKKGQEGREKFGYKDGRLNPFSSKTNREKRKNKNFMMIKHKVRGKSKRSFKDKQVALRNYLIKQKKMR